MSVPSRKPRSACAHFTPELEPFRSSRRSSALLLTLTILALVTILVLAFLGLASQDLKSTNFYVHAQQADQIARGGLEFVVGNLEGEIADTTLSSSVGTPQSHFYVPLSPANTFPQRMVAVGAASTNILLTSASDKFYPGASAPLTMASPISSTNLSYNNQIITASSWNKPMLVPTASVANLPIPNWVFVTRTGPTAAPLSPSAASSTVSPNLGKTDGVVGRYAFMVYDTSGLVDINVAGYDSSQPSMATNASGKGLLPYADLTQLPGVAAGDVNSLVQFRNSISETNYPFALANTNGYGLQSNGFMKVYSPSANGPSDSTFLSRQELIQYATSVSSGWSNALPYLTTFSREINGPTWGPTANLGGAYNYQTQASSTAISNYNPNFYTVKVQTPFVRNNGITAVVGEPLVKYRFPLNKLALLESVGTTYSYTDWVANKDNIKTDIQRYFGLDLASDSTGLYRHWQYPTLSTAYLHSNGNILSLAQVAALTSPREADFFELLQAGILNGSLGDSGRSDLSQGSQDFDPKTTFQLLRIGANIICQWKADSIPTTISYLQDASGNAYDIYGITDLPYITQMFTKCYAPNGNATMPVYPYIYFQAWNPHQAPAIYNAANYPLNLRIVPYSFIPPGGSTHTAAYSDNYSLSLVVTLKGFSSGAFKWFQTGSSGGNFYNVSSTYGGGYETNTSSGLHYSPYNPQSDYREPGLVVGTPQPTLNNSTGPAAWTVSTPLGGGSPSGGLATISLPALTNFPASTLLSSSHPNIPAGTTNYFWNSNFASTNNWQVAVSTFTTFVQQYEYPSGSWHTYGTFVGLDAQTPSSITSGTFWQGTGWLVPTSSSAPSETSWVKTDPRTFRFGVGNVAQQQLTKTSVTPLNNASNPPLLNPNSTLANVAWNTWQYTPFTNSASTATAPYRMDYWAVNNPNNPLQVPGQYFSANNSPYITDRDGVVRGADSAYAYSTSANAWGNNPEVSGSTYPATALPARSVMLNHPFHSVGDLGYVYRDDPFRTLDFMTPDSADAGLLDLFTLSEAPVVAGRINPNTPYPQVIQSLLSGAVQSSLTNVPGVSPTGTVPPAVAKSIAQKFVSITAATPIANRASMVTSGAVSNIINSGYLTDNGGSASLVKTEGESLVRSLGESSNTRTWNLLIDVIGQSGHFINNANPLSSGGKDNFVVEGERRYWLHIAIDRYTGKIVDQQLELVDQ